MARSRTPKFDASEVITNEIIRIIERGVLPWRKLTHRCARGVLVAAPHPPRQRLTVFVGCIPRPSSRRAHRPLLDLT